MLTQHSKKHDQINNNFGFFKKMFYEIPKMKMFYEKKNILTVMFTRIGALLNQTYILTKFQTKIMT